MKLNVGLTKKIGQPHYGSLSSSCHVEIELESSLLQNDAEAFYERTRQTFAACWRVVESELARGDQRRPNALTPHSAAADNDNEVPGAATRAAARSRTEVDNATASSEPAPTLPASASQLDYVRRLAARIGRAAALRVEVLTQRRFGKNLTELSRDEATRLILTLRAVKSGELAWESVLEESAA
jgi:hypothetical protein